MLAEADVGLGGVIGGPKDCMLGSFRIEQGGGDAARPYPRPETTTLA